MLSLSYLDLGIVALYLLVIFYSGYRMKKYVSGIGDYLVAGRSMGLNLGLISMMCTEIGMITYVYYAEMGYKAGFAALTVAFAPAIAFFILGKTGFVIKKMHEMKIMTVPEFFSIVFSKGVRLYLGILMAIGGILNFGVFPGVEAKFINNLTGIPQEYVLGTMVGMLLLVLLYTLFGGMVAVIFTNYIQYALLSFGIIFITIYGVYVIGWGNIMDAVVKDYGEAGVNPFYPDAFGTDFGIGFIVWQILFWVSFLVSWQAISMRLFSSKDSKTGQRIYVWSGLMFLARGILPVFWGIMALAYLGPDVEPLDSLSLMLSKMLPSGILGLILAGLLAASMSTYASYLLSWSSVLSQDVIDSIIKMTTGKELSSKTQVYISRITMVAVTFFIIWWSLFHKIEGYLYFYLDMTGMMFIPGTIACLVLGIYWKKSNVAGAYTAITLGVFPPVLYLILPEPYKTSWASTLGWGGFVLTFAGMFIGSWIKNKISPQTITTDR